jgi:hypothetical protein
MRILSFVSCRCSFFLYLLSSFSFADRDPHNSEAALSGGLVRREKRGGGIPSAFHALPTAKPHHEPAVDAGKAQMPKRYPLLTTIAI